MKVLVTGSSGFMGKHLVLALQRQAKHEVLEFDLGHKTEDLARLVSQADIVYHLAGVNRPKEEKEFMEGNADFTSTLAEFLEASGRKIPLVLSSSIQAELDNPYGRSKLAAEERILRYHERTGVPVFIFRFPNVFGKWTRPNYNTVVATFCQNISRGIPVQISNRAQPLHFIYIDDVVRTLLNIVEGEGHNSTQTRHEVQPVHSTTLGELHNLIISFREDREKRLVPDLSKPLIKALYSTYLSFLSRDDFARPVDLKIDARGWLFELVKSPSAGQIFVSRTRPGVTRGNHYHDTKAEKFCVIQGEGLIRFRPVLGGDVVEYPVSDRAIKVVDIPPGYTHSIENIGATDMLTLFWANEIFDPQRTDTYPLAVI